MPTIRFSTVAGLALACCLAGRSLHAQGVFQVQVTPTLAARSGDVVTVRYSVRVMPGSTDSLSLFIVDAPGTRLHVVEPAPASAWATRTTFGKRPVAAWMLLEQLTTAGNATPALEVSGAGVLDVVSYWAKPETPWGEGETEGPPQPAASRPAPDPVGVPGKTIGIVVPLDQTSGALAARLGDLIGQACTLGWIDNVGVCNSLQVKARADANVLSALQHELDAQRGRHISEAAYLLLSDNVAYLLTKL